VKPPMGEASRCRLVNPLCPEDLCWLPANHAGAAEGVHHLGTMAAPAEVSEIMYLSHTEHTAGGLIDEGVEAADRLFPDQLRCG